MKRDVLKYAAQGKEHARREYDLWANEAHYLYDMIKGSTNGIWDAICASYYMGLEAGIRQTKNAKRRKSI